MNNKIDVCGDICKDKKMKRTYVGYGIGQCYENTKDTLAAKIKLDYLCDRKWEGSGVSEYDGIPVISKNKIRTLENVLVVVFTLNDLVQKSIQGELENLNVSFIHVSELLGKVPHLTGKILKTQYKSGRYVDENENDITFDDSLPDDVTVSFLGKHNKLFFGKNIIIGKLNISMGNNGACSIGDNTDIGGAVFDVSNAKLEIGKSCLLSAEVIIRTHDSHHIFDLKTHKRVNYEEDVIIGEHVWVGYRAQMLSGFSIGNGSVVGAGAVTSGKFGDHVVIVGSPARVVRSGICWRKDFLGYASYDSVEECYHKYDD